MGTEILIDGDGEAQAASIVEKVLICVVSCSVVFFGARAVLRPRVGMCSVESPPTPTPVAASRPDESRKDR